MTIYINDKVPIMEDFTGNLGSIHVHCQKSEKQKEKQELAVFRSLKAVKDWLSNRLMNSSGLWKTKGSCFSEQDTIHSLWGFSKWPPSELNSNLLSQVGLDPPPPRVPGWRRGGGCGSLPASQNSFPTALQS